MTNQKLFRKIIGEQITNIYRVRISDTEGSEEDIELADILVFSSASGLLLEFIVGQESSETIPLTYKRDVRAGFELDENEVCRLYESRKEKDLYPLPFVISDVTELWAGQDKERFLVGVIFRNETRKPLLSLFSEGDEIDIVPFREMKRHIRRMEADYSGIKELSYGIPEGMALPRKPDQPDASNPFQSDEMFPGFEEMKSEEPLIAAR